MPTYSYKCPRCQREWEHMLLMSERLLERCPGCSGPAVQTIKKAPTISTFKPGVYEHIAPEPLRIETAAELQRACEKHGCFSPALENSLHKGNLGRIKEV